jgi:hypothetical protein
VLGVAVTLADETRPFGHVLGGILRVSRELLAGDWKNPGDSPGTDNGHFEITGYPWTSADDKESPGFNEDAKFGRDAPPRSIWLFLDDYRLRDYPQRIFFQSSRYGWFVPAPEPHFGALKLRTVHASRIHDLYGC